jgi:hypothetical protein
MKKISLSKISNLKFGEMEKLRGGALLHPDPGKLMDSGPKRCGCVCWGSDDSVTNSNATSTHNG